MSHRSWIIVRLDTHRRVAVAKHVTDAAWLKRAVQKLATKLQTRLAAYPAKMHNPSESRVVVGETWARRFGDGSDKIKAVEGKRVRFVDTSTGNTHWAEEDDFRKTHIAPRKRSNPARLAPGTRVTAVVYGRPREGVVLEQKSPGIVWVRWDDSARKTWMHADSLTVTGKGNPHTLETAAAEVLDAAKWPVLAQQVRSGKMAPLPALELAHRSSNSMVMRSKLAAAIRLVKRVRPNPYGRSGRKSKAAARAERKTVHADYWIETSTPEEMADDPKSPYRMVTTGGQRFALSVLDAIRAQKQGLEFRPRSNPRGIGYIFKKEHAPGWFVWLYEGGRLVATGDNLKIGEARPFILDAAQDHGITDVDLITMPNAGDFEKAKRAGLIKTNPSRSRRARASRATGYRSLKRRVGARTARAALAAIRRPAKPGNAAQSLYYLQHHQARSARRKAGLNPRGGPRIVYNKLLGGWYVVVGPHQTPLNGRFNSKAEAQAWLGRRNPAKHRAGKRGRSSRTRRAKRNPSPERERAERTFKMWHEFPSDRAKKVKVPSRTIPKHVVGLGKVVRIDYISNKWEGKPVTYTHSTKRPYPELVTDPDGRQLYLVGGRMKPTADGLVN